MQAHSLIRNKVFIFFKHKIKKLVDYFINYGIIKTFYEVDTITIDHNY